MKSRTVAGIVLVFSAIVLFISPHVFTGSFAERVDSPNGTVDFQIEPHPNNGQYALVGNDGSISIVVDPTSNPAVVAPINEGTVTRIDDIIQLTHRGTNRSRVWITDGSTDVRFYRSNATQTPIDSRSNSTILDPGATLSVGVRIDTKPGNSVEQLSSFTIHASPWQPSPSDSATHEREESSRFQMRIERSHAGNSTTLNHARIWMENAPGNVTVDINSSDFSSVSEVSLVGTANVTVRSISVSSDDAFDARFSVTVVDPARPLPDTTGRSPSFDAGVFHAQTNATPLALVSVDGTASADIRWTRMRVGIRSRFVHTADIDTDNVAPFERQPDDSWKRVPTSFNSTTADDHVFELQLTARPGSNETIVIARVDAPAIRSPTPELTERTSPHTIETDSNKTEQTESLPPAGGSGLDGRFLPVVVVSIAGITIVTLIIRRFYWATIRGSSTGILDETSQTSGKEN